MIWNEHRPTRCNRRSPRLLVFRSSNRPTSGASRRSVKPLTPYPRRNRRLWTHHSNALGRSVELPRRVLAEQGVLRPDVTVDEAADLPWLLTSFDSFDLLHGGRGVSADTAASEVRDLTLIAGILLIGNGAS